MPSGTSQIMRYHDRRSFASGVISDHLTKCDTRIMPSSRKHPVEPTRLKTVLEECDRTQDWLADEMGVAFQTVSRWANAHSDITWSQAHRIAQVLGIDPLRIFAAVPALRRIEVIGQIQAGHWVAGFDWPENRIYEVGIPDRIDLREDVLYGAEVVGTSMNRVYPPGTVLILRRGFLGRHELRNGRRYHVEMQRADGLVEHTVKRIATRPDGSLWMIPESTDPEFAAPIRMDDGSGHAAVVGEVVLSIIPETTAEI